MYLRIFEAYLKEPKKARKEWCIRHSLNHKSMKKVRVSVFTVD